MTTQKPFLGSAACLLLSSAMIAATPVLAQQVATTSTQVQSDQDAVDFTGRLLMPNAPVMLIRVEDVADANDELFNMLVVDAAGYPVGHFRRVQTKEPGDIVAVITLNASVATIAPMNSTRRTIAVLTDHVRYHPDMQLIIADLTKGEMDQTPSEFPSG